VDEPVTPSYQTKHVVIVIVDGARYSDTWGTPQQIPFRSGRLLNEGVMLENFRTGIYTRTISGHGAIITGFYEELNNNGTEIPTWPSIFQYFRKATGKPAEKAWVVASKDKLSVLANCVDPGWQNLYTPMSNCGVNGPQTGYRHDSITCKEALQVFSDYHPDLMLVNFREPDFSGHAASWPDYIAGIENTDHYAAQIWDYLQSDPYYRGTTTLIVTNDHGRHLDNVADGYISHGDNCEGCRHIEFIAAGPDFKKGERLGVHYEHADISATVAELLGFQMPTSNGRVMKALFK
jgi:hypothetical protein